MLIFSGSEFVDTLATFQEDTTYSPAPIAFKILLPPTYILAWFDFWKSIWLNHKLIYIIRLKNNKKYIIRKYIWFRDM